jgi:NAD/NADP transhydrogenase beta subunit
MPFSLCIPPSCIFAYLQKYLKNGAIIMQIDIGTALTILGIILGIIGALLGIIMKMAFSKIADLEGSVEKLEGDIKDVKKEDIEIRKEITANDKAQTLKTNDIDVTVAGFGQNYVTKSEFMFWQQQQNNKSKDR